jgi:hypothetical protein
MTSEQIQNLVKKLESFFIGFTAVENRLKNSNGMELVFKEDWKGQTIIIGLHAKHGHSIGCSFYKPLEKIFKDIRRRLMPAYHADFFETKKEKIELAEFEEAEKLKLKALASEIDGEICRDYGHRYSGNSEYIKANNVSIYQTYNGRYEVQLDLSYFDAMKMAKFLKDFTLVDLTKVEIDLSK